MYCERSFTATHASPSASWSAASSSYSKPRACPFPATNLVVGAFRVDCHWNSPQLTVELDGYRFHNTRHAWEQDRLRERNARARGDEFHRYTYGDVFEHPRLMMRELTELLLADTRGEAVHPAEPSPPRPGHLVGGPDPLEASLIKQSTPARAGRR